MPRLAPTGHLQRNAVRIAVNDALTLEGFQRTLDQAGYARVTQVAAHGDYAVRGSLVDFYPMGYELPVRVDFLDDNVESLRHFDPETQISADALTAIDTLPAREMPMDTESVKQFRQRYRRRFEGNPAQSVIYREVSERRLPGGVENYLPLFFDETATIWDYLEPDALVICLGDADQLFHESWRQVEERFEQLGSDMERPLLKPTEVYCPPDEHQARMAGRALLRLDAGALPFPDEPGGERNLGATAAPMVLLNPREEDPGERLLQFLAGRQDRILFAVESAGRREWLADLLTRTGNGPASVTHWPDFLATGKRFGLAIAPLEQGVGLPAAAIAVLSEQELFGQPARRRQRRRRGRDPETVINDLTDLRVGAPVVHMDHGVGRYVGLTRMDIEGTAAEFVTLEYAGGDRLHVPVSSLHLISRYTGAAPEQAPLHRLGTDQWQKARRRAAERIRDVAAELLDLYSKRAARPGRVTQADPQGYEAFAAGFQFTLTEDQAAAIDDVLADLASPTPMDRLVCGDVGFGKTEVALRAAFAVVSSGRQVAVLVPTTMLAQQHYETFSDRFADWPVTVEVLSRFRSAQEHRQILDRVAAGQVDIVIGTHRLLQKDVRFKDLGLVIVDEEHRFGVRHKEQLKSLRTEVDILTLTATPIPRTLNMALGSLRELSLITTPPESRLAIKTFVSTWSAHLIREACLRELKRGGQIYFVHNRVQDIESVAETGRRASCPEAQDPGGPRADARARPRAGHARLLPPAVRDPGLHGHYRERPRRSHCQHDHHRSRRAFRPRAAAPAAGSRRPVAPPGLRLPDRAAAGGAAGRCPQAPGGAGGTGGTRRRLRARDPRPGDPRRRRAAGRGPERADPGNRLHALQRDAEPHRACAAERARPDPGADPARAPDIDLHVPALLPDEYLPDIHLRLVLYKRIANAGSDAGLEALAAELTDRFGGLPEPTRNLLRVAALRLRAREAGITRVQAGAGGGSVEFGADTRVDPAKLVRLIETDPKQFRLDPRQRLVFRRELPDAAARLDYVERLIPKLAGRSDPPKTATARSRQGMAL